MKLLISSLAVLAVAASAPPSLPADRVFVNGRFWTAAPDAFPARTPAR